MCAGTCKIAKELTVQIRLLSCLSIFALLPCNSASAQTVASATAMAASAQSTSTSSFEPLNGWKTAVLSGDKAALAALYTSDPPAQAQTPAGKSEDPGEEPAFWSAMAAKGLASFEPKILQITKPQPGVTLLALRVELTPRTDGAPRPEIVSAAQLWVQQPDRWRIYMTQRSDVVPAPQSRLPEPAVPNTDLYPPPEEAKADVDAALAAAGKDHKRVILMFGANWCFDCHVLDEAFHSKELAPLVDANYIVVHVSIGDGESNLDLAKKYEVGIEKGVPSLGVVASDGSVLFGQKDGEFENSARIGPEDLAAFVEKWKPSKNN